MTTRLLSLALLGVTFGACTSDNGHRSGPVVRDSAGVQIVENGGGRVVVPSWEVTADPTLVIGEREGAAEYLFDRVVAVYRLATGEIVVGNGGSTEFWFYDEQGRHLRSAAGRGGGPGELRALYSLSLLDGDTLAVFDPAVGRIHLFSTSGDFVGGRPLDIRGLFEPPFRSEGADLLPDGTMLVALYENEPNLPTGPYRANVGFLRYNPATGAQDTLGWYGGLENFIIEVDGRPHADVPAAYRNTIKTWSSDWIYIVDTERYEIHAFDLESGAKLLIRRNVPNPPFTARDREEYEAMYHEYMERSRSPRANLERWLAEVPWPATKPAIQGLHTDRLGRLWVHETSADPDGAQPWAIYGMEGWLIGTANLPQKFTPMDMGRDYILGVWRDADGVEFVHMYGLTARDHPLR